MTAVSQSHMLEKLITKSVGVGGVAVACISNIYSNVIFYLGKGISLGH
jgi:hypothetical protein